MVDSNFLMTLSDSNCNNHLLRRRRILNNSYYFHNDHIYVHGMNIHNNLYLFVYHYYDNLFYHDHDHVYYDAHNAHHDGNDNLDRDLCYAHIYHICYNDFFRTRNRLHIYCYYFDVMNCVNPNLLRLIYFLYYHIYSNISLQLIDIRLLLLL